MKTMARKKGGSSLPIQPKFSIIYISSVIWLYNILNQWALLPWSSSFCSPHSSIPTTSSTQCTWLVTSPSPLRPLKPYPLNTVSSLPVQVPMSTFTIISLPICKPWVTAVGKWLPPVSPTPGKSCWLLMRLVKPSSTTKATTPTIRPDSISIKQSPLLLKEIRLLVSLVLFLRSHKF